MKQSGFAHHLLLLPWVPWITLVNSFPLYRSKKTGTSVIYSVNRCWQLLSKLHIKVHPHTSKPQVPLSAYACEFLINNFNFSGSRSKNMAWMISIHSVLIYLMAWFKPIKWLHYSLWSCLDCLSRVRILWLMKGCPYMPVILGLLIVLCKLYSNLLHFCDAIIFGERWDKVSGVVGFFFPYCR